MDKNKPVIRGYACCSTNEEKQDFTRRCGNAKLRGRRRSGRGEQANGV